MFTEKKEQILNTCCRMLISRAWFMAGASACMCLRLDYSAAGSSGCHIARELTDGCRAFHCNRLPPDEKRKEETAQWSGITFRKSFRSMGKPPG